jgi:hypothetical protein
MGTPQASQRTPRGIVVGDYKRGSFPGHQATGVAEVFDFSFHRLNTCDLLHTD